MPDKSLDLRSLLAAVEDATPTDMVDIFTEELSRTVGARHVALLMANFSGNALVRMSHVTGAGPDQDGRNERGERVPLPGTVHERVLLTQSAEVVQDDCGWLAIVPVTERGNTVGALEVSLPEQPDADTLDYLVAASHALAYVVVAARRHTDLFEWAQRDIPFSVSAEIQSRLLPAAQTVETGPLTLAGWLEPSHDAGGDTFDYSLGREHLYVSITDAMGHSVDAAMLATLTVGTLRNCRRSLGTPAEQADAANDSLRTHATADQFVTGLLMRFRLADGVAEIVNAGHPPPFLLRDGAIVPLELTTQPPLGVGANPYHMDQVAFMPGDRLLLLTDGYLERQAQRVDIEGILTGAAGRHPRQVVQELARKVREVTGDKPQDDATAVCIDWYGVEGHRHATGGASRRRATGSAAGAF